MKTLLLTLMSLLLFLPGDLLRSQTKTTDTQVTLALGGTGQVPSTRALRNYAHGLQSENDGVVESSLYFAVQLRLAFPASDMEDLSKAIDALVAHGRTHSIRHKAFMASTLFASPKLVNAESVRSAETIDACFADISRQITSKLVVQN